MYMQWPVVMAVFLIAMNIWVYRIDRRAGILLLLYWGNEKTASALHAV